MGSSCCTMMEWDRSHCQPPDDVDTEGGDGVAAAEQQLLFQCATAGTRTDNGSGRHRVLPNGTLGYAVLVPVHPTPSMTVVPSPRPGADNVPNPLVAAHAVDQASASSSVLLAPAALSQMSATCDRPLVQLEAMASASSLIRSPVQADNHDSRGFPSGSTLRRITGVDAFPSSQQSFGCLHRGGSASASNHSTKLSDGGGAAPLDVVDVPATAAAVCSPVLLSDHHIQSPLLTMEQPEALTTTTHVVSLTNFPIEVQRQLQQALLEQPAASPVGAYYHHRQSGSPTHSGSNSSSSIVRDPPLFNTHDHSWATTMTRSGTGTVFVLADSLAAELFGSRSFETAGGSGFSGGTLRRPYDSSSSSVHA